MRLFSETFPEYPNITECWKNVECITSHINLRTTETLEFTGVYNVVVCRLLPRSKQYNKISYFVFLWEFFSSRYGRLKWWVHLTNVFMNERAKYKHGTLFFSTFTWSTFKCSIYGWLPVLFLLAEKQRWQIYWKFDFCRNT